VSRTLPTPGASISRLTISARCNWYGFAWLTNESLRNSQSLDGASQKLSAFAEESKLTRARIVPRQKFGFKKKDKKKGSVVAGTKVAEVWRLLGCGRVSGRVPALSETDPSSL